MTEPSAGLEQEETEHDVDLIHECVVKMAKEISDFMDITPDWLTCQLFFVIFLKFLGIKLHAALHACTTMNENQVQQAGQHGKI